MATNFTDSVGLYGLRTCKADQNLSLGHAVNDTPTAPTEQPAPLYN